MRKFDPSSRVMLENTADGMNAQILSAIRTMDAKAKELKAQNKNPAVELAPEIDNLKGRIYLGYKQGSQDIRQQLQEAKVKFEADQIRNSQRELYKLEKAKLKIGTMTNEEVENLATIYGSEDSIKLTYEEAQLLLSRVKEPIIRKTFKENITATRLDQPYLQTDQDRALANQADVYDNIGSNVLIDGIAVDLESLIDFDAILEAEA